MRDAKARGSAPRNCIFCKREGETVALPLYEGGLKNTRGVCISEFHYWIVNQECIIWDVRNEKVYTGWGILVSVVLFERLRGV